MTEPTSNNALPTPGQPEGTDQETTNQEQVDLQGQMDPEILAIQREAGVDLFDGDPELSALDRDHGLDAWYQSVRVAAGYKKQRLASVAPSRTNLTTSRPAPTDDMQTKKLPEEMTAREAWKRINHKS